MAGAPDRPVMGNALQRDVVVRELAEPEYEAWTALVDASPHGSVYSLPAYLEALCSATGDSYRVLGIERKGELAGGIALYERRHRFGCLVTIANLLFYNGVVLARHETQYPSERTAREVQLCAALAGALDARGDLRVLLRNRATLTDWRAFGARGWRVTPEYTYVVALDDLDSQWVRVERNLRRLITRCEREGFEYVENDDFDALYRLHRQTRERKGLAVYLPEPVFRRYFERLHGAGLARLCHARLPGGGPVVASQLVMHSAHPVTHTVCAGSDREHLRSGVNAFLRWHALKSLAGAGFAANDLTGAGLDGVGHFKAQLGGRLEIAWLLRRPDARILRLWEAQSRWRRRFR